MTVGLTGGIGSGKSTVVKVFEAMGCYAYNSDERAKELYFNADIKTQVVALLGELAYISDRELNKVFIANLIFSNQELLKQLNAIIHPAVKKDFELFKHTLPAQSIILKETALLFEEHLNKQVDYTILVTAPLAIKIQRVMQRNNMNQADVEKRITSQWTDEQKMTLSDFIITNDGKQAIIPQVQLVLKQLEEFKKRKN